MTEPYDLRGQLAVVTGASRGIGLAVSAALARAGADVIGVSTSLQTSGSEVDTAVRGHGREFMPYAVDFADRAAVVELAEALEPLEPHILVNNAGAIRRAPASEYPLSWWDELLEVDLSSHFVLTQRLAAPMLRRGSGKIVFTASLLSFQGGVNVPAYTAAKSGIMGLTRALSNEWAAQGVNVNAIVPGYIATDNTRALREDASRNRSILERIPAGRWGRPEDIGGAAVFLASSAADYVSGVALPVDGGWLGR